MTKFSDFIFIEDEVICTDKYLNFSLKHPTEVIKYYKHDYLFQDGEWRGKPVKSCKGVQSKIVLCGHSDYALTDLVTDNVTNWTKCKLLYSVNNTSTRSWSNPLPLGITNWTFETDKHPIFGNTEIMSSVASQPSIRNKWIYCNFNLYTNMNVRRECAMHMVKLYGTNGEENNYITLGNHQPDLQGRTQFLYDMKCHRFTICPEGNGIDTHRLWEALYMGSIPIVKKNVAYRGLEDLPIAWINDWGELNKEWCETKWNEMKDKDYSKSLSKLYISYWLTLLQKQIELVV
jgi:hypothetical protein